MSHLEQAEERLEAAKIDEGALDKAVTTGDAKPVVYGNGPVGKQTSDASPRNNVPNLDKPLKNAIYLPVNDRGDESKVWENVTKVMKDMEATDVNINTKEMTAYGLRYFADTFTFARTRLIKKDGQLHIELRRLEGDGFTFADQYKDTLKKKLEQQNITPTTPDDVPKQEETADMMYLDLASDGSAMINYWKKKVLPDAKLQYNRTDLYDALSSLGWNAGYDKNFQVLKKHQDDFVGPVLAVLDAVDYLPTQYFAALTLNKFFNSGCFGKQTKWSTIETLCTVVQKYSASEDASANPQDMKRSRQLVQLIGNCLKSIEPKIEGKISKKTRELIKKIRKKDLTKNFGEKYWNDSVLKALESHTDDTKKEDN